MKNINIERKIYYGNQKFFCESNSNFCGIYKFEEKCEKWKLYYTAYIKG